MPAPIQTALGGQAAPQGVNMGQIQNAYQQILGRSVGAPGADFYMQSGKSIDQIRADLAASQEGQQYAQSGGQRFVDPNNMISGINYRTPEPTYGLSAAETALMQGLGGATDAIMQSTAQGRQDVRQGLGQAQASIGQGVGALDPFAQAGQSAQQLQAQLSGAMGPEAQAQAFANYQASPEQAFLREQGERSVVANQAALGGLGGGNVQKELTRFGTGLAAQDYGNAFNRLGQLSGQGLTAAGGQASLYGNQAGLQQGAGNVLGGMSQSAGSQIGQNTMSTGINLATGRAQAGRDIAGNVQSTTSGLSDLINQQGSVLSDLIGGGSSAVQNLIVAAQSGDAAAAERLAALLANVNTGSASQVGAVGAPSVYNPSQAVGQMVDGVSGIVSNWPIGDSQ